MVSLDSKKRLNITLPNSPPKRQRKILILKLLAKKLDKDNGLRHYGSLERMRLFSVFIFFPLESGLFLFVLSGNEETSLY